MQRNGTPTCRARSIDAALSMAGPRDQGARSSIWCRNFPETRFGRSTSAVQCKWPTPDRRPR
eukprot:5440820-Lingulodinium_polyedra.AAC.1